MFQSFLTKATKITLISAFILPGLAIPTVAEESLPTMLNSAETETLSNETEASAAELFCRMIPYSCWW